MARGLFHTALEVVVLWRERESIRVPRAGITDLKLEGHQLTFKRTVPGGPTLEYQGTIQGNEITGQYHGPFGELVSNGRREGTASDSS